MPIPIPRACLIAGPTLLFAGTLLSPHTAADRSAHLAGLAAHPARVQIGAVLFVLGHALLVPGLLSLLPGAATRVAQVAGGAAVLGVTVFGGLGFVRLYELAIAQELGAAAGGPVVLHADALPAFVGLVPPAFLCTVLGLVVLTASMARAGLTRHWVTALLLLGFAGTFAGGDGTGLGAAGAAALLVAFTALALQVRSLSGAPAASGTGTSARARRPAPSS